MKLLKSQESDELTLRQTCPTELTKFKDIVFDEISNK